MRALSAALYGVMAGDPTLVGLIGTVGSAPAIVTKRPVPPEATRPVVLAATVVSDQDADLMTSEIREIQRDVAVYGNAPTDGNAVADAAERIRALFHRRRLTVAGWQTIDVRASGPIDAPAEPQEIGRIVTLTIRLHRAA